MEYNSTHANNELKPCSWVVATYNNKLWVEELTELTDRPKLCVLKELVGRGFKARYVGVRRKKMRRVLMKLRGGTAELQVEMGR